MTSETTTDARTEARFFFVLLVLWAFMGLIAAAFLDATEPPAGAWNPLGLGSVGILIFVAGAFVPAVSRAVLPQALGDEWFSTRVVATLGCWMAGGVGSIALDSAFWYSESGLHVDFFRLQLHFGIALLLLGTYLGGRELAMTVGGAALIVGTAGYWWVPDDQLAAFLLASLGIVLTALSAYYAGIVARGTPRPPGAWMPLPPPRTHGVPGPIEEASDSAAPRGEEPDGSSTRTPHLAPAPAAPIGAGSPPARAR